MEFWFRGKRLSDNQWEYGGVDDKSSSIISCHQFIPIDPDTLGMHTGFHDVHRYGIFHGDILKVQSSQEEVEPLLITVMWSNWKFTIQPYNSSVSLSDIFNRISKFSGKGSKIALLSNFPWERCKIVGNLWDGVNYDT